MNRTVAAGCFVFLKRAFLQAETCVFEKLLAFWTETALLLMVAPAEDADHLFNRPPLSQHAGMHHRPGFCHFLYPY